MTGSDPCSVNRQDRRRRERCELRGDPERGDELEHAA
jgi:hypothetical protein